MPQFYFGVNLQLLMQQWWDGEFLPEFHRKYGQDAQVAVVILRNDVGHDWREPLCDSVAVSLATGSPEFYPPDGLLDNVSHKLAFVLRTGLDSVEAARRPDLVEPGDFPWQGAGTYRGYTGGASGLKEEADWWVFCQVVDTYILIRREAAERAINASHQRVPGMKYMEG